MSLLCGLGDSYDVPQVAKTPLVQAVKALIEILNEIDKYPPLYLNHRVLQEAIYRYEHRWVPLLASVPSTERINLVPPLDVEWVWFCHMLCPVKYIADSAAMWNTVSSEERDVIIDHKLVWGRRRDKGKERASYLWNEMFSEEPFDVSQRLTDAPILENLCARDGEEHLNGMIRNSLISYDIVAAAERQMAFHYQVCLMPQYRDRNFLKHAMDRYLQKFLVLQALFPGEVWVPTYDIDIVWHAHMMHPRWYKETTERLRGSVLPHDDTLNDRSIGSELDQRWNETVKKWAETFSASIICEGGMWRGNVEADERIQRPYVRKLIELVTKKTQTILDNHIGPFNRTGMNDRVDFAVSYGGDVNWQVTKVGWVHMTDWQRANRDGRVSLPNTEDKVERLTLLKHYDGPVLLTCRTVYFLMYDERGDPYDFRTVLEVFGNSPNIPIATAHHILPHTVCERSSWASHISNSYKRKPGESVMLLRVGGEDFGLLGAKWEGFETKRKGIDNSLGIKGHRGSLRFRLWLVCSQGIVPLIADKWKYFLELPVRDARGVMGSGKIMFDLQKSTVAVRHASHIVPAYLISMAFAALRVTLQPRLMPEGGGVPVLYNEVMNPERSGSQHLYVMLRGAGGETIETGNATRSSGLWNMLYQNMRSRWPGEKVFSESVPEIRAPFGAAPGGCDDRGGNLATLG